MKLFYSIFLIASLSSFLNAQNVTLTIDTTYLASTYKFTIENNTDSIVEIFPFGSLYNYLEIFLPNGQNASGYSVCSGGIHPWKKTSLNPNDKKSFEINLFSHIYNDMAGDYKISWRIQTDKKRVYKSNILFINKPKRGFVYNDLTVKIIENSTLSNFQISIKNNRKEKVVLYPFPNYGSHIIFESPSGKKFLFYEDGHDTITLVSNEERIMSINLRQKLNESSKDYRVSLFKSDFLQEIDLWAIRVDVQLSITFDEKRGKFVSMDSIKLKSNSYQFK